MAVAHSYCYELLALPIRLVASSEYHYDFNLPCLVGSVCDNESNSLSKSGIRRFSRVTQSIT